jgi:hypothetical protein
MSKRAKPDLPVVAAFKGFDANLQCRGFQYAVGETYAHTGPVEICKQGFHACENPLDVLNYYDLCDSRFALIEATGEIAREDCDTKFASAKITIKAELKLPGFVQAAVAWMLAACKAGAESAASGHSSQLAASGDYSQLAASGDSSQLAASGHSSKLAASGHSSQLAASGDSSQLAASGDSSQLAASGHYSKLAASGDYSQLAASGDYSQLAASGHSSQLAASGHSSIACAAGIQSQVKAGANGAMSLARWVSSEKRYRITVAYVGENGIKADVWYSLNDAGEFVEGAA